MASRTTMNHLARTVARTLCALSFVAVAGSLSAQVPAADPTERLREVLPADVAERVIGRIAEARQRELPAQALENRALKFAARGIAPDDIERAVTEHVERLDAARAAFLEGRGGDVTGEEIEAGAEALRQGVDGAAVSALAKSAPSGRSLAVPLYVIGSLVDRGLPSDEALARVRERLMARASDAEIERMPADVGRGGARGRGIERPVPATAGGRPSTLPRNGGAGTRPLPTRPETPTPPRGKRP